MREHREILLLGAHTGGRAWRFVVGVAAVLLLLAGPAYAENLGPGGGTRIITGDKVVGPFRLLITSSPEPAQVGTVTYVVRVNDPGSGEIVRDAEVTVALHNTATGADLGGPATHANAGDPIDYAAHIAIEEAGSWEGTVRVSAAAGAAEVKFVQPVLPQRQLGTLLTVGVPFIVVLGVLGGLWLVRSGSRRQKED